MPSISTSGHIAEIPMQPEHLVVYVLLTLAFFFFAWLVKKPTQPLGVTLILWGIMVVILSCGYGLIGVPLILMLAPALSKIGFLLVLSGVAWSLLTCCSISPVTKETDHVG